MIIALSVDSELAGRKRSPKFVSPEIPIGRADAVVSDRKEHHTIHQMARLVRLF
ncbi:hypothetical protein [Desulfosporosinus shakirovi]|uniref:hypothetical protein n=1 Tax=Desulfosporosinus shakirovi TaxID=2885154 RepID=UPI001E584566|nr:hypothetical protein [Desulfosporosinus sp. SRJS8]MCB8816085.1 hypothetical protein [Desulfosporosinus sp. SRJS8]